MTRADPTSNRVTAVASASCGSLARTPTIPTTDSAKPNRRVQAMLITLEEVEVQKGALTVGCQN